MPVFQPIVTSQPVAEGLAAPVAPAPTVFGPHAPVHNNDNSGLLNAGLGIALSGLGGFLSGYAETQKGGDLKEWQVHMEGIQKLDKDLTFAARVGKQDPTKADALAGKAIREVTVNFGVDPSDSRAAEVLQRHGFTKFAGIPKEQRHRQMISELPEYNRKVIALLADGMSHQDASDQAYAYVAQRIAIDEAISDEEVGARVLVNNFQQDVADSAKALRGAYQVFQDTGTIPPEEMLIAWKQHVQNMREQSLDYLVGADANTARMIEASLSTLEENTQEILDAYNSDELRQVDMRNWLNIMEEAHSSGAIDKGQYRMLRTTFTNLDPQSWAALVTDSNQFTQLMDALNEIKKFGSDADSVANPNGVKMSSPVLKGVQEVADSSMDAATGIAQINHALTSGDPATVVNPERRELAVSSLASIATYIGKAADNKKWINSSLVDSVFSEKTVEYYNAILKEDPAAAQELRTVFAENIGKYLAVVNTVVGDSEELEGIEFRMVDAMGNPTDNERVWQIGVAEIARNRDLSEMQRKTLEEDIQYLVDKGLIPPTGYDEEGRSVFRSVNLANLERAIATDPRWQAGMDMSDGETPRQTQERQNLLRSAIGAAQRAEARIGRLNVTDMLDSKDAIISRWRQFKEDTFPLPVVSAQELGKYSGLMPFLDTHEGAGSYDTLWSQAELSHPDFKGTKVSEMSIGDLIQFTKPGGAYSQFVKATNNGTASSPMGRYQIVGSTLKSVTEALNLPLSTTFSPDIQDRMFKYLVDNRLKSASTDAGKLKALRQEWPGLKNVSDDELLQAIATI